MQAQHKTQSILQRFYGQPDFGTFGSGFFSCSPSISVNPLFSAQTWKGCLGWKKRCLNPANPTGIFLDARGLWVDRLNIRVAGNFVLGVFVTTASLRNGFSKRSLNKVKSRFGPSCKILVITKISHKCSVAHVCTSSGNARTTCQESVSCSDIENFSLADSF